MLEALSTASPTLILPASRRTPNKVAKTRRRILSQKTLGGETSDQKELQTGTWRSSRRGGGSPADADPLLILSARKAPQSEGPSLSLSPSPLSLLFFFLRQRDWRRTGSAEMIKRTTWRRLRGDVFIISLSLSSCAEHRERVCTVLGGIFSFFDGLDFNHISLMLLEKVAEFK